MPRVDKCGSTRPLPAPPPPPPPAAPLPSLTRSRSAPPPASSRPDTSATYASPSNAGRGGCGGSPAKAMSDTTKSPFASARPRTAATTPVTSDATGSAAAAAPASAPLPPPSPPQRSARRAPSSSSTSESEGSQKLASPSACLSAPSLVYSSSTLGRSFICLKSVPTTATSRSSLAPSVLTTGTPGHFASARARAAGASAARRQK